MNAKRLIVTLVFAAILIGFFIWIIGVFIDDAARKKRIWREEAQKVTDASEYINSKNYDVMYFGEDLNAPQSFNARRIYSFSPDEFILAEDEGVKDGHIVIVNDPSGNLPLEKEDWNYMLGRMKYYDYILIYLGNAELKDMQEPQREYTVYLPECFPVFREHDLHLPVQAVHVPHPVFHELVSQRAQHAQLRVYVLRQIRNSIVSVLHQVHAASENQ